VSCEDFFQASPHRRTWVSGKIRRSPLPGFGDNHEADRLMFICVTDGLI